LGGRQGVGETVAAVAPRQTSPWSVLLTGLALIILALWLACEICARDLAQPEPKDPYRWDRWRKGDGA
jgi:hypothetical protein